MAVITIIGTNYVGAVYAAAFADLGNHVFGVDIDERKVQLLSEGISPIYEPGLDELVTRNLKAGRLRFTTCYDEAVPISEFVFICVGTPSSFSGEADMRAVRSAAEMIGKTIRGHTIIINKSTMPIGSGDLVTSIINQVKSPDATFAVVSNPEFLREGSAVQDVFNPSRIVLGAEDREAAERVAELYSALNAPVLITDRRTAEMIKYASNAILATRISFINEIAQICEQYQADVKVVAQGMGLDPRIGPLFLDAGIGFGGSCFPKDVKALSYMAHEAGCHPQLLHAVLEINQDQRRRFVHKLQTMVGDLHQRPIAIWGLSFKQDTDDIRESPAIDVVRMLIQRGAIPRCYDPAAMDNAREVVPEAEYFDDPYEAVRGTDALLVLTPWNEFKQADLGRVASLMRQPVLLDGRNIYDPADVRRLGFRYAGVGR
ncbi:UDP-glucose/GDP-mannose dehydrogenase family protein [Sphaerobacter sp.]|uniref:UDP-glucose dehydrogenase family protein n=1 Tax=Sphaerobacter sp. TaxID=2099654 RepID=UPI001DD64AE4|nr:UDP-glucose/GDP-mannose dehydrogenase family protein [Sphaerobacter sp.]MBX5444699.1 UDP-glucose/GDP-mannose dehydrogenase family protein [Sphaerobacter sp.]